MVGTPCWAASITARPHPSLRDGSTCTQDLLHHMVFGHIVDVAVKRHRVGDAEPRGMVDQSLPPPAAADDVEMQAGYPRPQHARRHPARPRSACAAPAATAPTTRGVAERGPDSDCAGASSRPLRTTAIRSLSTPRSTRSRADGSDTVTYWLRRCSRGDNVDSTNQPSRLESPARPPATARGGSGAPAPPTRRPIHQPGQERPAVLGIDRPRRAARRRSGPSPSRAADHRQPRPHVHRVPPARRG